MKHRRVPVEFIGESKFSEARAAIERSPVRKRGHTLPAILRCERSHIHPIARRHIAIGAALLIHFWIKVIARPQIPWLAS